MGDATVGTVRSTRLSPALTSLIGEKVGEASMCWTETPHGVFDSYRASRIIDEIENAVADYITQREVSMLASLQSIHYHSGQLQERIRHTAGAGRAHAVPDAI